MTSVQCANCGFTFKSNEEVGQPCPKCGSLNRSIHTALEIPKLLESVKLEVKKPTFTHKKGRADYELEQGEKIGKDGKLVYKKSKKDREHSNSPHSYIENVIDIETGEVIVDKTKYYPNIDKVSS